MKTLIRWAAFAVMATVAPLADAAQVTRGPYLQCGTPDAVTVRWRTDVATNSSVRYGPSPADLSSQVDALALTTEHEVALAGLTPEQQYYYSVGTTAGPLAGGDAGHRFRTSPPPGSVRPVRIWAIGDSGHPGTNANRVRDAYLAYPGADETDVWLMLGDNAYSTGTDAEYQAAVFGTYASILRDTVLWSTRGNHDALYSGSNNDYYDIFTLPDQAQAGGLPSGTEAYWSFDYANIHFVCLDSEGTDRSTSGAMATWLDLDLAATSQPWVLAFWHHPPYTKGTHNSDSISDSGGRMRDMRANLLPILEQHGVDLVLAGHSHDYERSFLLDGHYGTSGTLLPEHVIDGGDGSPSGDGAYLKPTYGTAPHEGAVFGVVGSSSEVGPAPLDHPVMVTSLAVLGSMVLDVEGGTLDAVFLDDDGTVRDRFRLSKGIAADAPATPGRPAFSLGAASPNPFTTRTEIPVTFAEARRARLTVLDVAGRRVATLLDGPAGPGVQRVLWNGRAEGGERVAPGTYFLQLEVGGETRVKKVVRIDAKRR